MRLFVAVNLSQEVRERLASVQQEMEALRSPVKWVDPAGLHITLKFLGEVTESQGAEVCGLLEEVAGKYSAAELTVKGVGAFPAVGRPRVIWAGVRPNSELAGLWEELDRRLDTLGFASEGRGFAPHVTLGRVRQGPRDRSDLSREILRHTDGEFGTFRMASVELMRSELTRTGAVYTCVHSTRLRGLPGAQIGDGGAPAT